MLDLYMFAGRSAVYDATDVVGDFVKVDVVCVAVVTNPQHIDYFVRYLTAAGVGMYYLSFVAASHLSFG
jgi:hypothetical protein